MAHEQSGSRNDESSLTHGAMLVGSVELRERWRELLSTRPDLLVRDASPDDAMTLLSELVDQRNCPAMIIAAAPPVDKTSELFAQAARLCPESTRALLIAEENLSSLMTLVQAGGVDQCFDPSQPRALAEGLATLLELHERRRTAGGQNLACELGRLTAEKDRLGALLKTRTDELRRANHRLEQLDMYDPLSGQFNRRFFHRRMNLEIERHGRNGRALALVLVEVCNLAEYCAQRGYRAGDTAIRNIGANLERMTRCNDVVARYGDHRFAILLPECALSGARIVARRLLGEPRGTAGQPPTLGICAGAAACPDNTNCFAETLLLAEEALVRAKQAGQGEIKSPETRGEH
jgi:diguanylate cyclase (GGDEF)-like protein